MADKQIGFVRVDEHDYDWLKAVAADAGIAITAAARAIIAQAHVDGWVIEKAAPYRIRAARPAPPVTDPFRRPGQ